MGLKPGDYLVAINSQKVGNISGLKELLTAVGIIQDLQIWRNGSIMVLGGVNKF
jgi:hypothetical protein